MSALRGAAFATFAVASICTGACRRVPATTAELQSAIAGEDPSFAWISREIRSDIKTFYGARQRRFAWVDGDGPTVSTVRALDTLRLAGAHGLDPDDYSEPALRKMYVKLQSADVETSSFATRLAQLDVGLTAALLRLGRHVATGRLRPDVLDKRWNVHREPPNYVAALQWASGQKVETFLSAVQPRHPEYAALLRALVSLQADDEDVQVVTNRPDAAAADASNRPIDARRRQVAINLERWRWLPDDLGYRHFMINVPGFHLVAREHGTAVLEMRVVVGKRGDETPLFSDHMEQVVFSPYWNVPETIAVEETAPAVARDPGFLARNNMEVVDRRGRVVSAEAIPWGDEGALREFRFRQRPGARNALGLVKFMFPNDHAVYLHDTPADALFRRIGRAFSHGCIRVEEPEALAQYVLRHQPEWTPAAIHAAMRAGHERHVKLTAPIPVHIVYMTAWVDDLGSLHLEDDVYGYDARQSSKFKVQS
jgi:murein L,D-transpeptidase YcbB/YkuD